MNPFNVLNPFHARWGFVDHWGSEPLPPRARRQELAPGDIEIATIAMIEPVESLIYPTTQMRQQPSLEGYTIVRLFVVEDLVPEGMVEGTVAALAEIQLQISVLRQSRTPVTERFLLRLGAAAREATFTKVQWRTASVQTISPA